MKTKEQVYSEIQECVEKAFPGSISSPPLELSNGDVVFKFKRLNYNEELSQTVTQSDIRDFQNEAKYPCGFKVS